VAPRYDNHPAPPGRATRLARKGIIPVLIVNPENPKRKREDVVQEDGFDRIQQAFELCARRWVDPPSRPVSVQ
jgi:hypothetical protein